MKILYKYLLRQVLSITFVSIACLTFILLMFNVYRRVFDLLINYDIPFFLLAEMILMLIPFALSFTIPWGLLIAILIVFGRMSKDLELQAVRASGIGLIPFITPAILLSIFLSFICLYNNAVLAPQTMRQFKRTLIDLGKNNPSILIRSQEPIDKIPNYRLWVGEKHGNQIQDVHIWEIDDESVPKQTIHATRGEITADLKNFSVAIKLFDVKRYIRGPDPTKLNAIQTESASLFPISIPLGHLRDKGNFRGNRSIMTMDELVSDILSPKLHQLHTPTLTEIQKRVAFSFAPFTFILIGIPLAITAHRKETSIGVILASVIAAIYYLLIVLALAYKHQTNAYPELIVWLPNILFQALGFFLLWKVNKQPA